MVATLDFPGARNFASFLANSSARLLTSTSHVELPSHPELDGISSSGPKLPRRSAHAMPANRAERPSTCLLRPVRLRSQFHAVLPAHDHIETVRDDVYAIFEQLEGPMFHRRGRLSSHVAMRSLDNFPPAVALHRGPPITSQESVGGVRTRPAVGGGSLSGPTVPENAPQAEGAWREWPPCIASKST